MASGTRKNGWAVRWLVTGFALLTVGAARAQAEVTPPPPPPEAAAAPAPVGTLEVATGTPGAAVTVDGQPVGVTPLRVEGVAVGPHALRVDVPGGGSVERQLVVQEGVVTRVEVEMTPAAAAPAPVPEVAPAPAPAVPPAEPRASPGKVALAVITAPPWGWMATALAAGHVVAWALLWSTSPSNFPTVGGYRPVVGDQVWRVIQWSPLVCAGFFGLVAVALYALPIIPLGRWLTPDA
ncbi:MAG: PEGA domain-containing protein [Deltaproteobacteria bacterium]|nr:PEGA domain-containing protein [Deltaproteobacteria bacterium]